MTDVPPSNRARGAVAAGFRRVGARTEVVGPHETGGYRLRLPRTHGGSCEAVIVNTGGGMAGGDRAEFAFAAEAGAAVTLTTTAAEKVYRGVLAGAGEPGGGEAGGGTAGERRAETRVAVALSLGAGAALDWLPQETILFDGARLDRRLDVDMAADADLLMAETLVFGRLGMGERLGAGRVRDRWRLRRGGRLALAEELDLRGDGAGDGADDIAGLLDRPALGGGARASSTVVWASPRAEAALDAARAALDVPGVAGGASAWNGMLVARALSPSPRALRAAIVALLSGLRGRALPRLWA